MIKLYFSECSKKNVIEFCVEKMTKYAWVLREQYVEVHGLSDVQYIFSQFADMNDYHIEYDIIKIVVQQEKDIA